MKTTVALLVLMLAGCAPKGADSDFTPKAHWIETNATAPFSGLLLDGATYRQMRVRLLECTEK